MRQLSRGILIIIKMRRECFACTILYIYIKCQYCGAYIFIYLNLLTVISQNYKTLTRNYYQAYNKSYIDFSGSKVQYQVSYLVIQRVLGANAVQGSGVCEPIPILVHLPLQFRNIAVHLMQSATMRFWSAKSQSI